LKRKNYGQVIRVPIMPEEIQKALKNAGYYTGAVDGKIGSGSKQAILDFQKDHNLKVDGVIGQNTWGELKYYSDDFSQTD